MIVGLGGHLELAGAAELWQVKISLPLAEGKYKGEGFGYAGVELYESGYGLGREAVRRTGFGAGDRAMVWGLIARSSRFDPSHPGRSASRQTLG